MKIFTKKKIVATIIFGKTVNSKSCPCEINVKFALDKLGLDSQIDHRFEFIDIIVT